MSLKHKLKNFALAFGLVASLAAGYLSVSIPTSKPADAILCFSGNQCITNMSATIGTSFLEVVAAKGLMLGGYLIAYLELAAIQWMGIGSADEIGFFPNKVKAVKKTIDATIDTFWFYNLRPSMQAMTEQLGMADAQQALAVIKFNDAAELNRTQMDMQIAEAESRERNKPSENACVAASVSGGMTKASTITRMYNATAPIKAVAGKSAAYPNGYEILARSNNAVGTPAGKGRAADIGARFENMVERYYDPSANGGNAGAAGAPAGPYKNADLDVQGQIFDRPTIDLTDAELELTINDLLVNLAEPFVMDNVDETNIKDSKGEANMLERNSYRAKRQVIFDALYHSIARRAPGSNMGAFIDEIRVAAGFLPPANNNPSHNEIMQTMMSDRFRSGAYAISQVDNPETNSKEMVIQQAFQAMQLNDQLDLLDRYAMVLAARAGENVNESKSMDSQIRNRGTRN